MDVTTNTDYKVLFENWSRSKQKVKNTTDGLKKDKVNNFLENLKHFVFEQYNKALSTKTLINKYWVKKVKDLHHNKVDLLNEGEKVYLTDFAKKFIENAKFTINPKIEKQVEKRRIVSYQNTLNILLTFQRLDNTKINFLELNKEFYDNFVKYLIEVLNHSNNTISNSIKNILVFAWNAKREEINVNPVINEGKFIKPTSKTEHPYLTEEQIFKIFNLDPNNNPRLENVRDLFITGFWTCLRISDLKRLTKENIETVPKDNIL